MTDLDLTKATEAIAESLQPGLFTLSDHHYGIEFDNPPVYRKAHQEDATDIASAALEAALPHIEAALRTQIANEIRAATTALTDYITWYETKDSRIWAESPTEAATDVLNRIAGIAEKRTTK